MTIAQDTTDALSRIDHALGVQDAMPALDGDGWMPGDPLYDRCEQSVGHAAPMISLRDDEAGILGESSPGDRPFEPAVRWSPRCGPCQVSWEGPGPCWVCGEGDPPRPDPTVKRGDRVVFMGFDGTAHDITPIITFWSPRPTSDSGAARPLIDDLYPPRPDLAETWRRVASAANRAERTYRRAWLNAMLSASLPVVPIHRFGQRVLRADLHEYRRRTRSRRGRSHR